MKRILLILLVVIVAAILAFFFWPRTTAAPATENLAAVKSNETQTMQNSHLVTIKTNYGDIQFKTYDADAPKTVQNFITLAQKNFYNGLIFHRIIKGFMIQGGDPQGTGMGGPGYQFEDELNLNTQSYKDGYKKGVVAMANAGPNTNGSQFFIMLENYPLQNNYTIFGHVVKGQDVVDKIGSVATGANDRPVQPVTMTSVTVEEVK
jgi:cyclophilin family peptidyl-prolyl cis-trans isomerase